MNGKKNPKIGRTSLTEERQDRVIRIVVLFLLRMRHPSWILLTKSSRFSHNTYSENKQLVFLNRHDKTNTTKKKLKVHEINKTRKKEEAHKLTHEGKAVSVLARRDLLWLHPVSWNNPNVTSSIPLELIWAIVMVNWQHRFGICPSHPHNSDTSTHQLYSSVKLFRWYLLLEQRGICLRAHSVTNFFIRWMSS